MDDTETTDTSTPEAVAIPFLAQRFATMEGVGSALNEAVRVAKDLTKSDIQIVAEPGTGLEAYVIVNPDGRVQALPESMFDEYRDKPKRRRGMAKLFDVESFIAHVNRFADEDTLIFADNNRTAPSLTAVLDYHKIGSAGDPGFGKHRSHFAFPLSDEWKAWTRQNGEHMKMVEFAAFLEDHIVDVMPAHLVDLSPAAKNFLDSIGSNGNIADPAKLMQLATGLQIYEESRVSNVQNLSSGEATIEFVSEHLDQSGQKLNIPKVFILGIPVFKGENAFQVVARLRYRKAGGSIVFWYELWRTDLIFDTAFDDSVKRVSEGTGKPVLLGRDENASQA